MAASKSRRRPPERRTSASQAARQPSQFGHAATLLAAVLIVVAGFAAYSNSFSGVFVFDDEPAIEQNAHLHSLWPLNEALSAPAGTTLSGRPVAALSFAIDYAVSGGTTSGYHATNLIVHLGAALLLFGIVRRTLRTTPMALRFGEAATPLALVVATLFSVHPLQTGAVTYLVQRVESLMGLFYLATLYAAIRALDAPRARASTIWTGVSVLTCALGMATKEVMVTAPLMVMLWDHVFARDRRTSRTRLYALLASTWAALAILVAGGHRTAAAGFGFAEMPWWRYLMTQAGVVAHYLRLSVVPHPLVLDYGWPPAQSLAAIALPAVLICALLIVTAWGLVRRAPAAFAGAWVFLILIPTSSVLPIVTEVAAEHRMYLPIAGIISLLALTVFAVAQRIGGLASPPVPRGLRIALILAAAAVIAVFARMTYQRNADYQSYDRIWLDTIDKRPRNARARNNYATSLLMNGHFADAGPHLRVAVEENPSFAEAEANLGVALSAQGKLEEGAQHLRRAVSLRPDYSSGHRDLGENYALQGRFADAAAEYIQALQYRPDDVQLLNRAAWVLATAPDDGTRDGARALAFAQRAVALTGRRDADSLDSLGAALAERGDFQAAAATAHEGARVAAASGNAEMAKALEYRASLYARGERYREGKR